MHPGRRLVITAAALLVVLLGGATVAVAQGRAPAPVTNDDDAVAPDDDAGDAAITGAALERAEAAALAHVGGGRVTGTEVDDEESWYEVEVTRDDGTQIDVQLDRDFSVVGDKADQATDD